MNKLTLALALLLALSITGVQAQQKTYGLPPRYYIAYGDSTNETIITPFGQTPGWSPSWSPDATRIAYVWSGDIFVMDVATQASVNLTNGLGGNSGPAWSPDGGTIAFHRHVSGGGGGLFVMNANGSDARLLATNAAQWRPTWSPDSSRLAFTCPTGEFDYDICVINADGTGLVQLTADPGPDVAPDWSPDGTRIVFSSSRYGLALMNPDGSGVTAIGAGIGGEAVWSPDGSRLAVQLYDFADVHNMNSWVEVLRLDGSSEGQVCTYWCGSPDWMPGPIFAGFSVGCLDEACAFDGGPSLGDIVDYTWDFGDQAIGSGHTVSHTYAYRGNFWVTLTVTDAQGQSHTERRRVELSERPSAAFTWLCDGPTCRFDASGSVDPDGTIVRYDWNFGDGTQSSTDAAVIAYSYANAGEYVVYLTVIDNAGGSDTTGRVIVANRPPTAVFTATCDGLVCEFDPSGSSDPDGGITTYSWLFGDGTSFSSSQPARVSHTYAANGSYEVRLGVRDSGGLSASYRLTIAPAEAGILHAADLDGVAIVQRGGSWQARVTILVHTASHDPAGGATVTGSWENATSASCIADGTGRCSLSLTIPNKQSAMRFTVTSIVFGDFTYDAARNHEQDGDSDGTSITIRRR